MTKQKYNSQAVPGSLLSNPGTKSGDRPIIQIVIRHYMHELLSLAARVDRGIQLFFGE
ncbi:MAG: hypothetical protein KKD44_21865 [Proteobacteria bacterium]|nr:hypothetical protein [Pseudomonadota bacterium]